MSLDPNLPDFASRALVALNAGQTVWTPKGSAQRCAGYPARPFRVSPIIGNTTWHASAPLAVALLRSL